MPYLCLSCHCFSILYYRLKKDIIKITKARIKNKIVLEQSYRCLFGSFIFCLCRCLQQTYVKKVSSTGIRTSNLIIMSLFLPYPLPRLGDVPTKENYSINVLVLSYLIGYSKFLNQSECFNKCSIILCRKYTQN